MCSDREFHYTLFSPAEAYSDPCLFTDLAVLMKYFSCSSYDNKGLHLQTKWDTLRNLTDLTANKGNDCRQMWKDEISATIT